MKKLSKSTLAAISGNAEVHLPLSSAFSLPEKVLQFGTGVLLRGLPDYLIDQANRKGIFNGSIVVVKSTDSGDSGIFDEQDNLYTLCMRGVENGSEVSENSICSAISRVLSAKSQWQEVLDCAKNPDLEIIISNTTEVGIQLVQDDIRKEPPVSFPGKLLAFLHARFKAFEGDKSKGMVIVPTELIPENGKKLEAIVLELAHCNSLENDFMEWLEHSNFFCNSLVDRIVPGVPDEKNKQILFEKLGYEDQLLTMSEAYLLWAIEGDEQIKKVLSFHPVHPNIIIKPDINLYRELKLRLLNGTHTLSCGLAFLSGFQTVKEGMEHPVMSAFISNLMLAEIAPAIPFLVPEKAAQRFGMQVLDRFKNPFVEHLWLNITVQYSSKMHMRNIPLLLNYVEKIGCVPEYFALGFAAYLLFSKPVLQEENKYFGIHHDIKYPIQDEKAGYFYEVWEKYAAHEVTGILLKEKSLWGQDLTLLNGFSEKVNNYLLDLIENGVPETLTAFMQKGNLVNL
ncbi:MAG: tagaturonate reductase [Verrucomicrobia bacterium]|nr:tagaturonate reductase [Cytophagales bacterium]